MRIIDWSSDVFSSDLWLYKTDNAAGDIPGFMHYHLGLLSQLHASAISGSLCDGINVPRALVYLKRLQDLVEKPSAMPMPEFESCRSDLCAFQDHARVRVGFSTRPARSRCALGKSVAV